MLRRLLIFWGMMLLGPLNPSSANVLFPFSSELDFLQQKYSVNIQLNSGKPITCQVSQTDATHWQLLVDIDDVMTPLFEITTLIKGELERSAGEGASRSLLGKIKSHNTLVNRQPVDDFSGEFEIKNQNLYLHYFSTGQVTIRGKVQLVYPFNVDLKVDLFDVDIKDVIAFFAPKGNVFAQGSVAGVVTVGGTLEQMLLKGQLTSYNGTIEDVVYQSLVLNAEGLCPKVILLDSHIDQDDGLTFTINGKVDLSDKENFDKQISALAFDPLVTDEGASRVWTLKRLQSVPGGATTEIKYLLRGNEKDNLQMDEEEDLFGVERKIEF